MSWKLFLYDWGGLNIALFQAINTGTPATLKPLAWFFGLVGSYWTAPLMLLGLWWWSKSATNPARGTAVRHRLIGFSAAFLLALLVATALKLWFDFPRPPAVLGDLARVIGDKELHYSLPSGHATYAAMVVGALWPLMGRRGRLSLMLYATLVGWSRIAPECTFRPMCWRGGRWDGAARHSPGGCCRWPPLCGNRPAAHRLGSGSPWPPVLS